MEEYIEVKTPSTRERRRYREGSSRRIMAKLGSYMRRKNVESGEIRSHKLMFPYMEFYLGGRKTGTLYMQAHLRHIMGYPRYWTFEFRLDGSESHMTLEDFTMYKLAMGCAFRDNKDKFVEMKTSDRYKYLVHMLTRLNGFHIEASKEKMERWFDSRNPGNINMNPYLREYKKATRSVSPRSKQYITIID